MKTQEEKRTEAEDRNQSTAQLTSKQRLDRLDRRLGAGVGAGKERARLERLLNT